MKKYFFILFFVLVMPITQSVNAKDKDIVEISYDQQQLIGVKTTKAVIKPIEKTIRTIGRVSYDETKLAAVNTKFEGFIEKLYVNSTGQYVKKGQILAEIYSPELLATQLEFLSLISSKENKTVKKSYYPNGKISKMLKNDSNAIINAARERLKLFDITDKQIEDIAKTQKPRRTLDIYSPVSGYVIQKQVVQGTRVLPGENLFDIADLSSVWIIADIYEQDLPLINIGQTTSITINSIPNRIFKSKINYIYPAMENSTRTAKIRFNIPNYDNKLKPQMFTNLEIAIPLGNKLVIPKSAIIDTGKEKVVYVDLGKGRFQLREVETGYKTDNLVEIKKGIKPGELVATSANFLIDSEAQLKGISH